jgi:hypothetical protein
VTTYLLNNRALNFKLSQVNRRKRRWVITQFGPFLGHAICMYSNWFFAHKRCLQVGLPNTFNKTCLCLVRGQSYVNAHDYKQHVSWREFVKSIISPMILPAPRVFTSSPLICQTCYILYSLWHQRPHQDLETCSLARLSTSIKRFSGE